MGTARMGDEPASSVVDRFGMCHDVPNLGVLDGSVFVTSGGVNPTSTICALASRVADKLLEHRARIPRPEPPKSLAFSDRLPRTGRRSANTFDVALSAPELDRLTELAEELIPASAGFPT